MDIELPADVKSLFQRAASAQMRGDIAQADALYSQMVARAVASAQGDRYELGVLLRNLGRLKEACAVLEPALRREPARAELRYELGATLMALGNFPEGWPMYETRREIEGFKIRTPQLPFPEWKGQPLAGKRIVLFPEQGLGDNIQFARFALTLRDRGAAVVLLCRPALARLLAHSLDGVDVQAAEGTIEMGEPDYWALFGSLPIPLGLTLETIPNAPYLRALPDAPPRPAGGPLRVGLVTQGSPVHQNDERRSLGADQAARLRALPVKVISLHPEDTGARDFADTAAIVHSLDLVVTVDTSVAHLAGAMGKPTFVLIPGFCTDWRWLQDRSDSPWYPTLQLFRSGVDGDWTPVLDRVEAAVRELTARASAPT